MNFRQRGFTLIEVLVAGLIMFLVLSSMSLVYRGALLSSGKAEKSLSLTAAVPSIRALITESFRDGRLGESSSAEGRYGDLDYKWSATLTHKGQSAVVGTGRSDLNTYYFLWDVELTVIRGSLVKNYQFRELSW